MQGPRLMEGAELAETLRQTRFNGPIHWRELYSKAETTGTERVGDEDCYKVTMTPKDAGKPETLFFGIKSGLLRKRTGIHSSAMGEIPVESIFSDYRNVDGVLVSFKGSQKAAGQEFEFISTEMKANVDIPASRFEPPAEIKALLNKRAKPVEAPKAAAPQASAKEQPGRLNLYMNGNQIATETYTLRQLDDGGYELSGSGSAQMGPMRVDIEEYRVVTDNRYRPLSASARAKLGQVNMSVKTTFSGGLAHNEIDTGQGPQKKDDPAGADDVVISQNLPLFPFTLLARRLTTTKEPQIFKAYILGQKEVGLQVVYRGVETVEFAARKEDLNHFTATLDGPQGTPITAEVWVPADGSRIIRLAVPAQRIEVYQDGYAPAAAVKPAGK